MVAIHRVAALLAVLLSTGALAQSVVPPAAIPPAPSVVPAASTAEPSTAAPGRRSGGLARVSCVTLAVAAGAATSLPMVLPLWFSGAAKGVAAYNGTVDVLQRAEKAHIGPSLPLKNEQALFGLLVGMVLGGATINTLVHVPPFLFFGTAVPLVMVMDEDGVFSDLCHGTRSEAAQGTPLIKPRHLALMSLAAVAALVPMPVVLLPTIVATGLILMSLGLAPTIQRIPGLGLVDMLSAFKRAGLLEAATYPALYVSAAAGAVLLVQGMLLAKHLAPVLSGPVE